MSNIFPWAPLIFVTLTMIGCSSEDPETTKVGSSNQTQLSDKKPVDRHAVTLNGMTVSLTGNPNRVEVVGYLRERGMQQGFKKTDNGMAAIMVVHGIMTTGTKGETALSQCIATSGLMALDKLSNSLGGQEVRSQLKKNSVEAQPTYAKELVGGVALTFNTDDGSVRYEIESRSESTTRILEGQRYKSFNQGIQISDDSGTVCAYKKDGRQRLWDCDIQALNKLFRNDQRRSEKYVVAKWLYSELDGTSCHSAFGFSLP